MRKLSQGLFAAAAAVALSITAVTANAAGGGADLPPSNIDPGNVNSLQRGARNFMNYCSGCHSAQYVRYSTIGEDLQLSEELLLENLMFNAEKTHETINVAMRSDDAEVWFGVAPPDLSLTARSKGADYIYNFLLSYYVDESRATGVDNTVYAGTAMPHVLGGLQGYQRAVFDTHENEDGDTVTEFSEFELVTVGTHSPEEFEEFVRDTTNFLAYIAEPMRSERRTLGVWVIIFLSFFLILAHMLKKQIWKDVK
ncbi:MAG: cytochrome c1 [Woeseiaceae bacterium]|nr:cytochrome c1 [Woeseiaceae bacterium]